MILLQWTFILLAYKIPFAKNCRDKQILYQVAIHSVELHHPIYY